ncbi:DSD1 family PLP-dependent enzyme [Shewanella sp. Isolate13]|uniref:DSD1 family PLP-dependent enzyme n=1 Tax=Shewanella sp. Isolate13 TaxID=2908531 RepID=UPI001EFC6725|nr:DSD1 family PLP-dependent enzyme [Shewanella sp. Isolate13]MCG9731236.1 DSD1 family PLP-dependent enzyme [Shewanella sp. Isolate13]
MLYSEKTNPLLLRQYQSLDTPFLSVDKQLMLKNLARLRSKTEALGAELRPHFKTVRALEAVEHLLPQKTSAITVSTVKEAEALAGEGYTNIVYAVGISEGKLPRIEQLIAKGAQVRVLLDTVEQAQFVSQYCKLHSCVIPAMIEVDCDGHRGGIHPDAPLLIEIANILHQGAASLHGVLAHAGESYLCFDPESLVEAANNEVNMTLKAANNLRAAAIPCDIVSIGSTPTAHSYQDLTGITEVRAGVYGFFDLVMTGIGVCRIKDIAASVVTTVIGHNREKGWIFIDAGWMALSLDRGTSGQPKDCGYGLVTDCNGTLLDGLQVITVNQEHGIIASVGNDDGINFDDFPVGSRLHILPNHGCATASMHQHYHVFDTVDETYEIWNRIQGW